ncbi:DR2241 family protein [Rubrobacter indicoceani]|uniref:DR2241 family protein n=1 Tax=Rubrobacter indicoceani TaxID=2051957 RepID=UPI000E5C28EC|nr:DR2241 family protein [Rubrobacter indicoceani]
MAETHRKQNVATAARLAFAAWVGGAGRAGREFGEVKVLGGPDGSFTVHHREEGPESDLEVSTDPRAARLIARLTDAGDYRPLKSSPNLRRGWRLDLSGNAALLEAMNGLYPAAVAHWHLEREGRLEITSFRENAGRQSGIYERIKHLSDEAVQNAARACCEDSVCLKRTLWDVDEATPLAARRGAGEIPCPEPCSVFVAFARKVRSFEKEEPYRNDDPNGLTPSERKDLAALVGSVADGRPELAREAEFDEPLNARRMRYRRLTLIPKLEVAEVEKG